VRQGGRCCTTEQRQPTNQSTVKAHCARIDCQGIRRIDCRGKNHLNLACRLPARLPDCLLYRQCGASAAKSASLSHPSSLRNAPSSTPHAKPDDPLAVRYGPCTTYGPLRYPCDSRPTLAVASTNRLPTSVVRGRVSPRRQCRNRRRRPRQRGSSAWTATP
jgi:hypothetical protein